MLSPLTYELFVSKKLNKIVLVVVIDIMAQPPPQVLCFSHGRGESKTRVTGDELQGTMGRVQTSGEAPARSCGIFLSRLLSPSHLPLRQLFHRKREVWQWGWSWYTFKLQTHFTMKNIIFFLLFQRHANNLLQLDNGVKVPPRLVVIYGLDNLLADCLGNRMAAFFWMGATCVFIYFVSICGV